MRYRYTDGEIVIRDKNDIENSDIVLVYWKDKGNAPSVGTAMEVLYSYSLGIPVLFVGDWAADDIWMRYHVTKIYSELDEAIEDIKATWL